MSSNKERACVIVCWTDSPMIGTRLLDRMSSIKERAQCVIVCWAESPIIGTGLMSSIKERAVCDRYAGQRDQ